MTPGFKIKLREWVKSNTSPAFRRVLRAFYRLATIKELRAVARFVSHQHGQETFLQRCSLLSRSVRASFGIKCGHRESEALSVIGSILGANPTQPGCIVEAGAFKGGSAAKFSLAAGLTGRQLVIFDSFQGIPPNAEQHVQTDGVQVEFPEGEYAGSLEEVRDAIRRYGDLSTCRFVEGWFDETMPGFDDPVAVAYIDVDLASSTRTCLRCLYPHLVSDGVIYSQDGHLELVVDVLRDDAFWLDEVGVRPPVIAGLGADQLLAIPAPG